MSFSAVQNAILFETHSPASDETKSVRVRRGVYTLRKGNWVYMIRIRVPAGIVTTEQLRAVAQLARETRWAAGVHFTTRQGIELAGVPGNRVIEFLNRLDDVGLTTLLTGGNAVRGVVCCPLSGVAKDQIFDVTPHALAIDEYFRNHSELTRLPRKIKIAFESCPHDHVRTLATDIGLTAVRKDGKEGFRVVVAGGLGASPKVAQVLEEFIPVEKLLPIIEAILRVFNRHGNRDNRARARLKWLVGEWGIERFKEAVRAEEVEERELPRVAESGAHRKAHFISGEVPDEHKEAYERWSAANVTEQQQEELISVFLRIPGGDLLPDQVDAVVLAAERFADGVRTSIEQNIVLRNVARENLPALYEFLRPQGLALCCAGQITDVTRCVGAAACLSAITSSHSAAEKISEVLQGELGQDPALKNLRIRVSGCHNSCSHHHAADIGLFGISKKINGRAVPHYAFLAGGRSSGGHAGARIIDIPAARVAGAVTRTLELYRSERTTEESFSTFVERTAESRLKGELAVFTSAPTPEEEPEFYRDINAEIDFKVESKRGECAY